MSTINTNHSRPIYARLSTYAHLILEDQRRTMGAPGQPASQAHVIELALGLLQLSNAGEKINRARTLLWNSLQREVSNININDLATQMTIHKNKRGRRSKSPRLLI